MTTKKGMIWGWPGLGARAGHGQVTPGSPGLSPNEVVETRVGRYACLHMSCAHIVIPGCHCDGICCEKAPLVPIVVRGRDVWSETSVLAKMAWEEPWRSQT